MSRKVTGVSFGDVHSYNDWGLKLKSISLGTPSAKTSYVSVPGMNGSLDLTEAQNGGVVYDMRTLKFTFDARNCSYTSWPWLVSKIAGDIEGKELHIDTKLQLTSMQVYIADFSKDTITLGKESTSSTYTSSNSHRSEQLEEAISNIPSKSEILEQAFRDATDMMNQMNTTGHAIHTKSEFIVSDAEGVDNAKNLWRWGLGGLAPVGRRVKTFGRRKIESKFIAV